MDTLIRELNTETGFNLRSRMFSLSIEDLGILLSSKKLKNYDYAMNVLFYVDIGPTVNIGKSLSLKRYADAMLDIANQITDVKRFIKFTRSVLFYPVYLYEEGEDFDIRELETKGILFNPNVSVEDVAYCMTILTSPLPKRSLFFYLKEINEPMMIQIAISTDVTGKLSSWLITELLNRIGNNWWTSKTDMDMIKYITNIVKIINRALDHLDKIKFISNIYQPKPIKALQSLFSNIVILYIQVRTGLNIVQDNIVFDFLSSLFASKIKLTTTVANVKLIVSLGLQLLASKGYRQDDVFSFISNCICYLGYSRKTIKKKLSEYSDIYWLNEYDDSFLFD